MTLREQIKLQKAAGHSSKICLTLVELQKLIDKAEAWDRLPAVIKDAGKKLQEVEQ